MKHSCTKERLILAVEASTSVRQTLVLLGVSPLGGNYKVVHKLAKEYGISLDHFNGQSWAKGRTFAPKSDLAVYLNNEKSINSYRLKQRLLSEGVFEPKCSECEGVQWFGKPMPLELDHIDGNSNDNRLTNLRLLCPNCHSFTSTYRGKNQKRCKK